MRPLSPPQEIVTPVAAEVGHGEDVSAAIGDASSYSTVTSGDHEAETTGGTAAVTASRGGVGGYWEGAKGSTVPEDLFSHRIMEEGECGPVVPDTTKVSRSGGCQLGSAGLLTMS